MRILFVIFLSVLVLGSVGCATKKTETVYTVALSNDSTYHDLFSTTSQDEVIAYYNTYHESHGDMIIKCQRTIRGTDYVLIYNSPDIKMWRE